MIRSLSHWPIARSMRTDVTINFFLLQSKFIIICSARRCNVNCYCASVRAQQGADTCQDGIDRITALQRPVVIHSTVTRRESLHNKQELAVKMSFLFALKLWSVNQGLIKWIKFHRMLISRVEADADLSALVRSHRVDRSWWLHFHRCDSRGKCILNVLSLSRILFSAVFIHENLAQDWALRT